MKIRWCFVSSLARLNMNDVRTRVKVKVDGIDVNECTFRRALKQTQPKSGVETPWFLPYQRVEAREQLLRMMSVAVISLDVSVYILSSDEVGTLTVFAMLMCYTHVSFLYVCNSYSTPSSTSARGFASA